MLPGYEAMAGVFGYFSLPEMFIGVGTKEHGFDSDFHITNQTRWNWWANHMERDHSDLNIHLKPDVSVLVIDPLRYRVNVDKHVNCVPTSVFAEAEFAGEHYGKPPCNS